MKITKTKVCITAAFIPLVVAFGPSLTRRSSSLELRAAVDDVPDIVKAYAKKVKPEAVAPAKSTPIIPDPVPVPEKVALPEVKVDVPEPQAIQSAVSDSVEAVRSSLPDMKGASDQATTQLKSFDLKSTADQLNAPFKPLNDFLKATQEVVQSSKASAGATHSSPTGGNVPTLGEFLQGGLAARRSTYTETYDSPVPIGKAPSLAEYFASGFKTTAGGVGPDTLAESKAKLALLADNTFNLFTGNGNGNLPDNMSPEMATGLAVATFVVFAAAAKNNQNSLSPEMVAVAADGSSSSLAELARDVKKMSKQIEQLTEETQSLRAELKDAKNMLIEKDARIGALEKELMVANGIEVEEPVDVSVPYNAAAMLAYEASDKSATFETFEKKYLKEAVDLVKSKQKASAPPAPAAKKAPAKKQSPGPRGTTAKATAAPKAKAKAKAKSKAKAKAKTKKVAEKVKVVASKGDGDWASLSDSTLARKTVKELVSYLDEKGVDTKGEDGKPMKKALLLDAVRSL